MNKKRQNRIMQESMMQVARTVIDGEEMFIHVKTLQLCSKRKNVEMIDVKKIGKVSFEDESQIQDTMSGDSGTPVFLMKIENEQYEILDGNHRVYKARSLNEKFIKAYVFEKDEIKKMNNVITLM